MDQNQTKYYDIVAQGRFYKKLKEVTDITQLSDNFITSEQMEGWSPYYYGDEFYDIGAIRDVLTDWSAMIKSTSACTSLHTSAIRTLLHEVPSTDFLSKHCPNGFHVKGDRIFNQQKQHEFKQAKERKRYEADKMLAEAKANAPYSREAYPTRYDTVLLGNIIENAIRAKYAIKIHRYYSNSCMPFAKRLLNWNNIRTEAKKVLPKKRYQQDIIFLKQIWDDPDALPSHLNI